MSLRTRLTIFVLLFGSAVLTNVLALLYLAGSVSVSLQAIERTRQRQFLAIRMDSHLRDAEAALYRYQINREAGFKFQFTDQLNNFADDLGQYRVLASEAQEQTWVNSLEGAYQQAHRVGNELITLSDQQNTDLQSLLDSQAQLTSLLLTSAQPDRPGNPASQESVNAMQDASRAMLSAVTGYLASPDETKRIRFTEAIINFRRASADFRALIQTASDRELWQGIDSLFKDMQTLGSRLIGQRDLQQSQYANFIAIVFNAGQQTIVGQIQPYEAENFSLAQTALREAVNTAILLSVIIVALISAITIIFMVYLSHQINQRVDALLHGAERVASGNLHNPVVISGTDEFGRLADSFNHMMSELASREEHLQALIEKMAQIQDEERRLIGLDLHDGLTQLIISANMHLNTLNALIGSRLDPEATIELDVGRTLVKQSIDEARKVIAELRPTMVEDFGLDEGLRRYIAEVCENQKWSCEVEIETGDFEIHPSVSAAVFRIVQEAISNARKHAYTLHLRVTLQVQDDSLFLQVQDWGQGFDLAGFNDDLSHLGLVSMQERAQMLGGSCQIESEKGAGTIITVTIPLAALAERNAHVAK